MVADQQLEQFHDDARFAEQAKGYDPFPPMPFAATLRDVYAAFFIQFPSLIRMSLLPFLISCICYFAGDVWMAVQSLSPRNFWLITALVQVVEILLFYFYSLALFRLLLLGSADHEEGGERGWLLRLLVYAGRALTLFLPLMLVIALCAPGLRWIAGWQPILLVPLVPLLLLLLLYLFLRLGFTLPAAAVDAPYSIFDSWMATRRIAWRALGITLLAVGPVYAVMITVILLLKQIVRPVELFVSESMIYQLNDSYWITVPVGLLLSYLAAAMLVIALAVMFYVRTGWRPGAVRADRVTT